MKFAHDKSGFSLVEVTMVLAISVVMIAAIVGIFNNRKEFASNDAASQIISVVQTAATEAKQGLGPAVTGPTFNSGETLWGEAVEFRNSCDDGDPCLRVYKLKRGYNPTTRQPSNDIIAYEHYDVATPLQMKFEYRVGDCTDFLSCYTEPGSQTPGNVLGGPLLVSPTIPNNPTGGVMIVILNGSGDMYAFNKDGSNDIGPTANQVSEYKTFRRGNLRIATQQQDGNGKYFITFNLDGSNTTDKVRQ